MCALLFFVIEGLYFPFSYASVMLGSASDWALFEFQGLASAVLFALAATLIHRAWRTGSSAVLGWVPAAWQAHGLLVQALLLASVGLLLVNNGAGKVFRAAPLWQSALAVVPAVLVYVLLRPRVRRMPFESARALLLWVLVTSAHWAGYADMYLKGRFGLDNGTARLRTAVMLGLPCATALVFHVFFARERRAAPRDWLRVLYTVPLMVALYVANARLYVDDSLDLHRALWLLGILSAWHLAELVPLRASAPRLSRALPAALCLGALAAVVLLWSPASGTPRYVGGVHATFQRVGLEAVTRFATGWRAVASPFRTLHARLVGWGLLSALPPSEQELPSTFHPGRQTPRASSEGAPGPELRGLVLFLLDMKRPRDLGLYGSGAPSQTPALDGCFEQGFVFEAAYSASNSTAVAYPTLYSGTYAATRHQNHPLLTARSYWSRTAEGWNLGESFRKAGFDTVAVLDHWYHRDLFQPAKQQAVFSGFSRFHVAPEGGRPEALLATYEAARPLFSPEQRFVLVLHVEAHEPELLPAVDRIVGRVCADLEAAGLLERTVLFLTADHGVQYREHGRTTYGHTLFDEEIRVPLLWRVPGLAGRRIADRVSSVDHLTTLLDVFGLPQPFPTEGRTYLPAMLGRPLDAERVFFSETRKPVYSIAALRSNMKLIHWPGVDAFALFDLERDPSELRNLAEAPAYTGDFHALRESIESFRSTHHEPFWAY